MVLIFIHELSKVCNVNFLGFNLSIGSLSLKALTRFRFQWWDADRVSYEGA